MKSPLFKGKNGLAKNVKLGRIEQYNRRVWECNICRKELPFDAFCKVERHWSGLEYMCRGCSTERRLKWRQVNYWQNRANDMNRRSSVNYLNGDELEIIWEESGHKCYYCEVALEFIQGNGSFHFDHVINGLNNKDNLVISCFRCNNLKSDATAEELIMIAEKILAY